MKKTLTHADIVRGRRYKVVRKPKYLSGMEIYPWLHMTGKALWTHVEYNTVGVQFGGRKLRVIPPDCLEEAEDNTTIIDCDNQHETVVKNSQETTVTEQTAKLNQLYRISKTPDYWKRLSNTKQFESVGKIGKLINIRNNFGTLCLAGGIQRFVPFDCMESVIVRIPAIREVVFHLSDEELIARMVAKPKSTLKIIRGLAKMNKDYRLRSFLDRGILF